MAYPRTAAAFNRQLSTEEACWDYLVKLRWPEGFRCPDCGRTKAWLTSTKLFRCVACESAVSVTAGTIFQDTRKPLKLWFQAMGWVVGQAQFTDAAKREFADGADGWLIAYARVRGCVVVTREQPSRDVRRRVPIPNVCDAFGVAYLDTFEMLRRLGMRLTGG